MDVSWDTVCTACSKMQSVSSPVHVLSERHVTLVCTSHTLPDLRLVGGCTALLCIAIHNLSAIYHVMALFTHCDWSSTTLNNGIWICSFKVAQFLCCFTLFIEGFLLLTSMLIPTKRNFITFITQPFGTIKQRFEFKLYFSYTK